MPTDEILSDQRFFWVNIKLAVIKVLSLWEKSTLIKIFRRWGLALYEWFHTKQVTLSKQDTTTNNILYPLNYSCL